MEKDKRLMEPSGWERLSEGNNESCSDGWGHVQQTLIQLSVDGWSCVPSLLFTWGQTMVVEKAMATHSSVLAWRIPGMREPGGLLSMGSHRVVHD